MNDRDFNRDPVESDEFFGELADMIDLVDAMTRERLSNGELDRRRDDIMDRVRRRKTVAPTTDTTAANTTPASCPDMGAFGTGKSILTGRTRIGAWETEWQSLACLPLREGKTADAFVLSRLLTAAARAAAMADAERYRDSALQKAAAIVKKAQQEADDLRAEAQRILAQARQEAAETMAAARAQADRTTGSTGPFPHHNVLPSPPAIRPSGNSRPAAAAPPGHELQQSLEELLTASCDGPRGGWPPAMLVVPTVARARTAACLLGHGAAADAGLDVVCSGKPGDPLLLMQCKYSIRSSTAWSQLWGPTRNREHHWPEHLQRAECDESALLLFMQCSSSDWDGVANVALRWRTAQVDECELSRRLLRQWRWRAASTAYDVEARCLSEFSTALHSDVPTTSVTASLPVLSPVRRLLLACDVEGFARADTSLRSRWQHTIRQIIGEAAAEAGLDSSHWLRQARGDGEIAILPAGTPQHTVFDQLLTALDRQLREHNRYTADVARLRLRVAVHEGVVASDVTYGFAGQAANTVSRLVDAPPLRRALSESPSASMAVAISDPVYQDVAHDRSTAGRERYVRVTVPQTKGTSEAAWVFVPGESLNFPSWDGATAGADTAGDRHSAGAPRPPAQLTGASGIFAGDLGRQRPQDEARLVGPGASGRD